MIRGQAEGCWGEEHPERFLENFCFCTKQFWKALEIIYMEGTKCLLHPVWSVRDMELELKGASEVTTLRRLGTEIQKSRAACFKIPHRCVAESRA